MLERRSCRSQEIWPAKLTVHHIQACEEQLRPAALAHAAHSSMLVGKCRWRWWHELGMPMWPDSKNGYKFRGQDRRVKLPKWLILSRVKKDRGDELLGPSSSRSGFDTKWKAALSRSQVPRPRDATSVLSFTRPATPGGSTAM